MNTFLSCQFESKMACILGYRVVYFGVLIVPVNAAQIYPTLVSPVPPVSNFGPISLSWSAIKPESPNPI
jgi:hypothetical protein